MLKADHLRDELASAFPHSNVHPSWCDCGSCRLGADPIAAHRERVVRIQAVVLGALVVALYGLALFLAPQIADAFRPAPDHIEIERAS